MKKVLVWGTFDILHLGHLNFLKRAKEKGDTLIILVSRDKVTQKIKGKKPLHREKERLEMIRSIKYVDQAYVDRQKNDFLMVKKIRPDIICLGYDQKAFTEKLPEVLKKFGLKTKVIRLKPYRPEKYKSTKIKEILIGGLKGGIKRYI